MPISGGHAAVVAPAPEAPSITNAASPVAAITAAGRSTRRRSHRLPVLAGDTLTEAHVNLRKGLLPRGIPKTGQSRQGKARPGPSRTRPVGWGFYEGPLGATRPASTSFANLGPMKSINARVRGGAHNLRDACIVQPRDEVALHEAIGCGRLSAMAGTAGLTTANVTPRPWGGHSRRSRRNRGPKSRGRSAGRGVRSSNFRASR